MICPYSSLRENPITHKLMMTPCGKCVACRVSWRLPWEYRLYYELRKNDYCGCFVTMTYSDDKYDINDGLCYQHIKTFFDELRKDGLHFKYFITGEYGEQTARCHWHCLFFGVPVNARKLLFKRWSKWCYEPEFVVAPITQSRIRYTLKYMDKESCSIGSWNDDTERHTFEYHLDSSKLLYSTKGIMRPRSFCSKGLGVQNYIDRFQELYFDGTFREGYKSYKPSKYQIECLSRNDIFFQCQRDQFLKRNAEYQKNLHSLGSELQLWYDSLNQSKNFISEFNEKELKNGKHIAKFNQSKFDYINTDLKINYDQEFKKEVKRLQNSLSWKNQVNDLARLALNY